MLQQARGPATQRIASAPADAGPAEALPRCLCRVCRGCARHAPRCAPETLWSRGMQAAVRA